MVGPVIDRLQHELAPAEFADAWERGLKLDSEDVIRDAVAWLEAESGSKEARSVGIVVAPGRKTLLPDPLTERELEVLALIAAGKSNRQIAAELTIAMGTVKTHVHNICDKLHAQNRTEAVALARGTSLLR
jgi:ATP/maltotriose-dependent transcriptional regulator MalT